MRNLKGYAIWAMAALMSVYMIGCACQDDECNGGLKWYPKRPTVTFVAPANAETGVAINRKIIVTFSEPMNTATINPATFLVTGPGLLPVPGTIAYDALNQNYVFTPDSDLLRNTTYTATITLGAENPKGVSLAVPFVWTFITGAMPDATPPEVIFVNPADLATGVPINTTVTAIFSEVMDPTTLTKVTFTVTGPSLTVSGTVTCIGTIATFTPSSDLADNTLYTATITTGATDTAGNALAVDFVWTFTTGDVSDATRPTVISTVPADGAAAVPLNTAINITFSKPMLISTITTANFTLKGPGGILVGVTLTNYNPVLNIATFTPNAFLATGTTYIATVTTGVQDSLGNHMLNNYVWSFTTAATSLLNPSPIALGTARNFVILSAAGIDNSASTLVDPSKITGDIGVSPGPGTSIVGFASPLTCPEVTLNGGKVYKVDATGPACAVTDAVGLGYAMEDLNTAFVRGMALDVPAHATVSGNLGGLTLAPGIYRSTSSLDIGIPNGDLTLDAAGDANAVWIFQMATTLTTVGCVAPPVPCTTGGNVFLTNGALPQNVFWLVGSSASLGGYTLFQGIILADTTITIIKGTEIRGRLLAGAVTGTGAVTIQSNIITIPPYINP